MSEVTGESVSPSETPPTAPGNLIGYINLGTVEFTVFVLVAGSYFRICSRPITVPLSAVVYRTGWVCQDTDCGQTPTDGPNDGQTDRWYSDCTITLAAYASSIYYR